MAFPLSAVFHFPPVIYSSTGSAEIVPQLLRALGPENFTALQFLKKGKVRATFKSADLRNELLRESSFLFGDVRIPVTASDAAIRSVFVRDLPVEVSDVDVQAVFEPFGVVHSIRPQFHRDFPSVANGTRILLMSFDESTQSIPSSMSVSNFPVRVWHAGQPVICSICREPGHLPQVCPFSGRCLRCKQPGHMARDCKQARGPSRPSPPSVPVSTSAAPVMSSVQVSSAVPSAPPSFSFSAPTSLSVSMSTDLAPVPSPPPSSNHCPVLSPVDVLSSAPSTDVEEGEIVSEPVQSIPKSVQSASKPVSNRAQPVSKAVTRRRSDLPKLKERVFSKVKVGSKHNKVRDLVADILKSDNLSVPMHEIDEFVKNFCCT